MMADLRIIENLVFDLDGTLADSYEPLSPEILEELLKQLQTGTTTIIITDEIEENLEERVIRNIPKGLRLNMHFFTDGGTIGFGFDNNGNKIEYFEKTFSQKEKEDIISIIEQFVGEENFVEEDDSSEQRIGLRLSSSSGAYSTYFESPKEFGQSLEAHLNATGIKSSLSLIGNGIFRIYPFDKADAIDWAFNGSLSRLQLSYGLPAIDLDLQRAMIIADQTGMYRNDWRMFVSFPQAMRVHVGSPEKEFCIEDSTVISVPSSNEDLSRNHMATLEILRYLNSLGNKIDASEIKNLLEGKFSNKVYSLASHLHFDGNGKLFRQWLEELHVRSGMTILDIINDLVVSSGKTRYPMLPEEEWLYLLPFVKKVSENGGKPVFIARGTIPSAYVWQQLVQQLQKLGFSNIPLEYEMLKMASFEDIEQLNPYSKNKRANERPSINGNYTLAITLNSLLSEAEALSQIPRSAWKELIKIYEAMPRKEEFDEMLKSNRGFSSIYEIRDRFADIVRAELIQIIADIGFDERYIGFLRRFYSIPFYSLPITAFQQGQNLTPDSFIKGIEEAQQTLGLELRCNKSEKEFMKRALQRITKGGVLQINSWEDVWRVNQTAIEAYEETNHLGGLLKETDSLALPLLQVLMRDTGFYERCNGNSLIGIDDSTLTGRTAILLKTIGKIISPRATHPLGAIQSSSIYGRKQPVDFVCTEEEIIYPEKEAELYDRFYRLGILSRESLFYARFEAISYGQPASSKLKRSSLDSLIGIIKSKLSQEYTILEDMHIFRKDTTLDPFEQLVFYYLRDGNEPITRAAVEEFLPNSRYQDYHFINLGRRMIEFGRNILPAFMERLRIVEKGNPELFAQLRVYEQKIMPQLIDEIINEFNLHRQRYQERQLTGLNALKEPDVQDKVNDYFAGRIDFEGMKRFVRPKIKTYTALVQVT